MIVVAGHYAVEPPSRRDEHVAAFAGFCRDAREATGCVTVSVTADTADPARVVTLEIWETQEALDAFRARADPPEVTTSMVDLTMAEYVVDHVRELFGRD